MLTVRDRAKDTICAVSTPPGLGGISILRVSGEDTLKIVRKLASFLPEKPESHRIYYGVLRDPQESDRPLDEVLISWFAEGRSFTGETTAEISCHGNPLLCREILEKLISLGARTAEPGEFTLRAFMNNRIDLVQAESVLSLIESRSSASARLALRQLQGDLSKKIAEIEDDLTWAMAHIEAGIDFSHEGLDVVDHSGLKKRLDRVEDEIKKLLESFRQGRVLREGLRIVFAGRPNVGKSSLLNNFLEEDRAIVSDIAGTTRDVIEGETMLSGTRLVFLDTAGLRDSADQIEKMGIERSHRAQSEADLIFFVFDLTAGLTKKDEELLGSLDPQKTVLLGNKADLLSDSDRKNLLETLKKSQFFQGFTGSLQEKLFFVSALDKKTRDHVLKTLMDRLHLEKAETSATLSSARHFEKLSAALESLGRSRQMLADQTGSEFVAVDLKESLIAIQEVLGKRFDDQIMDRVFKDFCIGK